VISYGLGAAIGAGIFLGARTKTDSMMAIQATYGECGRADQAQKFLDDFIKESAYLDKKRSEIHSTNKFATQYTTIDAKLVGNKILMSKNYHLLDDYLNNELNATEYSNSGVIPIEG